MAHLKSSLTEANRQALGYSVGLGDRGEVENRTGTFWDVADHVLKPVADTMKRADFDKLDPKGQNDRKNKAGYWQRTRLKGGRRKRENVEPGSILTFDLDFGPWWLLHHYESVGQSVNYFYHTSRRHSEDAPRFRLAEELSRPVSAEEYEKVARCRAAEIGIDLIDPVSFRPNQMMYRPSYCADDAQHYRQGRGGTKPLDVEELLARHPDVTDDPATWPRAEGQPVPRQPGQKVEDPLEKGGLVGAFCRAHPSISDEINDGLLSDVYEATQWSQGRVTRASFRHGSGGDGAVIYDDLHIYSHHGTDPCGDKLVNIYDAVRLHRGYDDAEMRAFAESDPATVGQLKEDEGEDFDDDDVQVQPEAAEPEDGELATLSPDDCADFQPVPYVVKELIAQRDMVTVVGAPGVGKSVLAPHLAYSVAQGRPVCGKRTRKGVVLYLAAENDRDMQKRIAALRTRHGACPDLHMLPACGGKFRDNNFLRKLRRLIQRLKPSLIVVDTLRAALPGIKENDSEGMGEAITTMRSLTKWGAAVLLVDHDNVAGSGLPRGHGSLHGDVDMNLHLKRNDDGDVIGTPTKNRNGESYRPVLAYAINPVDLKKLDEDGDPLTTVICEEKDVGEAKGGAKSGKLPRGASVAYAVLRELSQGGKPVAESEWRDACVNGRSVSTSDDEDSRARAFRRAAATLMERETVAFADGHYSLVGIRQPEPSEFADDFADPEEE